MSLYIASLNSGSNGNCYYAGNDREGVLIDAGISCRETEKRFKRLNLDIKKVKAIFISHEHSDHIKGLRVLSKKHSIPVYISEATATAANVFLESQLSCSFFPFKPVQIGALSITPFPKFHDAADPFSFIINHEEVNFGVFTDIGLACANVIKYFQLCHAAILEANYDEEMLESGNYPYYLKQRIRSSNGHLSNDQALEIFMKHRAPFMSHLLLGHLSENNNCPLKVENLFTKNCRNIEIVVASRTCESALFYIQNNNVSRTVRQVVQQSLF